MRLPPAGACDISIQVEVEGGVEVWTRDFGTCRLVTQQWEAGGLLIEQAGPSRFGLLVSAEGEGMSFRQRRAWVFGAPVPLWMAMRVEADVVAEGEGWRVSVRVAAPVLGEVVRYEGKIEGT